MQRHSTVVTTLLTMAVIVFIKNKERKDSKEAHMTHGRTWKRKQKRGWQRRTKRKRMHWHRKDEICPTCASYQQSFWRQAREGVILAPPEAERGNRAQPRTRSNHANHPISHSQFSSPSSGRSRRQTTPPSAMTAASPQVVLQAPGRFRASLPTSDTFDLIWDSGASISVTPDPRDFPGGVKKPSMATTLKGIAKGLKIEGEGHVEWLIHDTAGTLRTVRVPAYLVPKLKVRLLSTSSLLQTYLNETIQVEGHQLTLSGLPNDPTRNPVIVPNNPNNNLPMSVAYRKQAQEKAVRALNAVVTTVDRENINLPESAKELLRWHYRLGHIAFKRIQFLFRSGVLASSEQHRSLQQAASKLVDIPRCAACQFGKQQRRPAPGTKTTIIRDREGVIKKDHLYPGQQVSVDHFVSSTKGRLFTSAQQTCSVEVASLLIMPQASYMSNFRNT